MTAKVERPGKPKLLFVVNVDWAFLSHRLPLALAARHRGWNVHIATQVGSARSQLERWGLKIHALDINRNRIDPFGIFKLLIQLWRVMRQEKPDVVHLVTLKPVLLGGVVARCAGVPSVVAAVPGLGYVFMASGVIAAARRWLVVLLYRVVFGHPGLTVIFQNEDDMKTLQELTQIEPARVRLIHGSGVDLQVHLPTPLPPGPTRFLLAARLVADKGVCEFVEAAKILIRQAHGAGATPPEFFLAGDVDPSSPTSLSVEQLASWEAEGAIHWLGHRDDVPELLQGVHAVVLPSYREGLPKILLEAAAAGRAVITTDVPGCRDAIEPGVTGLLVRVKDAESLAEAMRSLANDRPHCEWLGVQGRRLAEKRFSIEEVVSSHMRIYEQSIHPAGS